MRRAIARELALLSLVNIRVSPLRAALTVLGLAIGIGAILTVVTLGGAGKRQVETEMTRLGIDRVWLMAAETGGRPLQAGDAAILRERLGLSAGEQAVCALPVSAGERAETMLVAGCDAGLLAGETPALAAGRALSPLELSRGLDAAMLSTRAAETLFGGAEAAVGQRVSVAGVALRVTGVLAAAETPTLTAAECGVWVSLADFTARFGASLSEIVVFVGENGRPEETGEAAVAALSSATGGDYRALTLTAQRDAARQVIDIFVRVLGWVAAVCMVLGGIGVMNMMLVSVRERRREIGVMKALGATAAQIALLFLSEAVFCALIGGGLGVVLGALMIRAASVSIGLSGALEPALTAAAVALAGLTGAFFGVVPACRAAAMQPVDALRPS